MGTLIDDLLAFSRVSRAPLALAPVDMDALARSVAADLSGANPDRAVAVDITSLAAVPGDGSLLGQVWANLLGNAFKFTKPVAHPVIEVRSDAGPAGISYTVRDNGVGFDSTYVDRLFKPFQRLHSMAQFEGTGIGLAIVARIVQRHGGRVWAEGAPGAGALFGFSLPASVEAT